MVQAGRVHAALEEGSGACPCCSQRGSGSTPGGPGCIRSCAGASNIVEQVQQQAAVAHHEAKQGPITVDVETVLSKASLLKDFQHLKVQEAWRAQQSRTLGGYRHSRKTTGGSAVRVGDRVTRCSALRWIGTCLQRPAQAAWDHVRYSTCLLKAVRSTPKQLHSPSTSHTRHLRLRP